MVLLFSTTYTMLTQCLKHMGRYSYMTIIDKWSVRLADDG